MRRLALHESLLLLAVAGCGEPARIPPLPDFAGATRVVVTGSRGDDTLAVLNEPAAVARLIRFVDARNVGWEVPWAGVPVPQVRADFYDHSDFRGSFGAGPGFFETHRAGVFASREASREELLEFARLISVASEHFEPVRR